MPPMGGGSNQDGLLPFDQFVPGTGGASTLNDNCKKPKYACGECETDMQNEFNDTAAVSEQ